MKKKLTNNLVLKIMSLAFGFLVWLIVANIDDPVITRSFTVQNVELVNEAYIDGTGKVCLRDGQQTAVRVTVTGQKKIVNRINASDIYVAADLQQAVSLDTSPVMIPITVSVPGITPANISVYPQNFSVTLEDKVTSEFLVSVNVDGKPGRGYEIGSQTVYPEKLRITGPRSLMSKIDKVNVSVNVNGMVEDRTESASISVMDKNADGITGISLSNLRLENEGKVTVTTKLWKVRTDVRIDADYSGTPAAGYVVDGISTVPETVGVAGSTEALDNLREEGNVIQIPAEEVDISGADADVDAKVNISDLLGENLKLTTGTSEEVLVTVKILPDGGRSYTIPTSSVKVENLPYNFQVSFEIDKIELRVNAENGEMDDFDVNDVKASIDFSHLDEGNMIVPVEIVLPEGYELIDEVTTEIKVSRVSTVDDSEG